MSHVKTFAGTSYTIPDAGDRGWSALTTYLDALADYAQTNRNQKWEAINSTSTPYAVLTTDTYIGMNVSSASTVNLPAGTSGRLLLIADESNNASVNNITVTPAGANTIAGAASYTISGNNQAIGIIFRGTDWKFFGNFSSSAITESSVNTFSNKSLQDSTTYIVDQGDATKKFQLQVNGITTATTRTGTVPDADFTFATTDTAQTFTGVKTIQAPVITGAATIQDTAAIVDDSDATKKIAFQASGITTGNTRTITMPDFNVNLGALTNTNIDAAAAIAITKVAPGTANQIIGANSGATANEYKSLAVGSAGTDFAIAHTANTITLDIPNAALASRGLVSTAAQSFGGLKKMEGGVIPIGVIAANDSNVVFTNTDNRVQISTPTAARTYTLPTTSIKAGEIFEFYNQASTSTYIITLNASGGTTLDYVIAKGYLKIIALQDTPTTNAHWKVLSASSQWILETPVLGGCGTVTSAGMAYKRFGDAMIVNAYWLCGTVAASLFTVTVPSGFSIDSSKFARGNLSSASGHTIGVYNNNAATNVGYAVTATGTSTTLVYHSRYSQIPENGNSILVGSVATTSTFTIPISGWGG